MKWPYYLKYALRDTMRALTRHLGMGFLTIVTIAITIFVLGVVSLVALNSQSAATKVENELEMMVFLQEEMRPEDISAAENTMLGFKEIESVQFISKDEALNKLDSRLENDGQLRDSLNGENPLPNAFKLKLAAAEETEAAVAKIKALPYVQEVRYGEQLVQNVVKLNQSVKIFMAAILLLMFMATIFLINSTIRLTVSNRHEEIQIMSFIGASPGFIRVPFFIEGIVIGGIGSFLAVMTLYFGYNEIGNIIKTTLPFVPFYDQPKVVFGLFVMLISCGVLLGAIGSAVAVRKYLKI